ncbi:MAG TPA: hemerythrin domain-containing protein [Syntrophales bacterium]|nr:hemerythrin domain-containing protein [Syntrophales bacterium]HRT70526.1 hemerythrin domain-containing protein [Syntrophales bacterium]
MKPIGPLMWEHRLIEEMIRLLNKEIENITGRSEINLILIDQAVDFFRTYSDRTHHGKEEEILFRELAKKPLSIEHRRIMEELIEEHVQARKNVGNLVDAKKKYLAGSGDSGPIANCIKDLTSFYPPHIVKEDKRFFFPCLNYFSETEQELMLQEFWEFDRQMIHEKYAKLVEEFLGQKVIRPGVLK